VTRPRRTTRRAVWLALACACAAATVLVVGLRSARPPERARPPDRSLALTSSAPAPTKKTPAPTKNRPQTTVSPPLPLAAPAEDSPQPGPADDSLSADELAVLERYSADDLDVAIRDAETSYLDATDDARAALERQYYLVLNLAAKLSAPPEPPPMPADMASAYALYERTLESRADELSALTPEQRQQQVDELTEAILDRFGRDESDVP
jgi:hypothetical protein